MDNSRIVAARENAIDVSAVEDVAVDITAAPDCAFGFAAASKADDGVADQKRGAAAQDCEGTFVNVYSAAAAQTQNATAACEKEEYVAAFEKGDGKSTAIDRAVVSVTKIVGFGTA
ncbi:hypothetical protein ACH5RR_013702 [Cinchona calisaya]|uniref:Uncharacterized protein n=1 Tax=Cinchona calisaya TaxID=153742 RepID=A0ABD3A472_9GENT